MIRPLLLLLLAFSAAQLHAAAAEQGPRWLRSDRAAMAEATRQDRPVILYLEAVWCHWCHVMDASTYADPEVRALIEQDFVALRIDQDLRPDLANRYRDYGWPATIILAADGSELRKRQGYIHKDAFLNLLKGVLADPTPEKGGGRQPDAPLNSAELSPDTREWLQRRHRTTFDPEQGALRSAQKYMDRDQVEYALHLAERGDAVEAARARKTLSAAQALLDPVWGGVYQYSTHGDWAHPHFEKLTRLQAEYIRVYALACLQFRASEYCRHAQAIERYMRRFLLDPERGFMVSQDADLKPGRHSAGYFALDDAGRRQLGMPRIDRSVYAAENGLMIEALVALYEATDDAALLQTARTTGNQMLKTRSLTGGGFSHGPSDQAGPFLADTLAMGRGLVALYRATGERAWLDHAAKAGSFIVSSFQSPQGFNSAARGSSPIASDSGIDEVLAVTRFLNVLSRYTGDAGHRAGAQHGLRWLSADSVARSRSTESGILLLDAELASEPLHLTVRGSKSDPAAKALHAAALRIPAGFRRVEWWDSAEGALRNDDVEYPQLKRAAAFVCTERTCSTPIHEPERIAEFLDDLRR